MFILGLVTGSFLNVCIYRIPREESIIYPPSHCPKCDTKLGIFDLIPVISYLILRGRCRDCGEKISIRYPIVEIITAALFTALYVKYGFSVNFAANVIFAVLLILISFIDMEHLMIPDFLMLTGIGVGLAYSLYKGGLIASVQGICFAFIFMFTLGAAAKFAFKKEALGEGDIKLLVMFGAFMGIEKAVLSVAIGSVAGAVISLMAIMLNRLKMDDYIPYAPFLALGAVVAILI